MGDAARRQADAETYSKHDRDLCMLCHARGADKRSWYSACFYDLHEIVPEALSLTNVQGFSEPMRNMFYMRICKACRAEYLELLYNWHKSRIERRHIAKDHNGHSLVGDDDPERNIPVRIHGVTKMLTLEEWNTMREKGEL